MHELIDLNTAIKEQLMTQTGIREASADVGAVKEVGAIHSRPTRLSSGSRKRARSARSTLVERALLRMFGPCKQFFHSFRIISGCATRRKPI
jgi:hypothetical protein